jgi:hypothetical protein
MISTSQLAFIAGPGLAGVLVHAVGIVVSFAFDALTFVFTSVMLMMMRVTPNIQRVESGPARTALWGDIGAMFRLVRQEKRLQTLVGVLAAINLLFSGPLIVGSATLSRVRFDEGSAAFGMMLSSFAVGMLIGTVVAGIVHPRRPGLVSLLMVALQGVLMITIGFTPMLFAVCALWLLIGCGAGFGSVNAITLIQRNVPAEMMGRVMSLMVLAEVGLSPISNAIAGVLGDWNVTALFVGAGGLLTIVTLLAALNPEMHAVDT